MRAVNGEHPLLSRLFLCFVLLISLNARGDAQNVQCSLRISDLPAAAELAGFQLGMSKEQIKLRVPQVKFGKTDDFGVSKTTINPFFDSNIDKTPFEGMRSISLDFLDDRLASIWIGYESNFKANTIEKFSKTISQSLHLPQAWTPWHTRGQQMRCANFQLTLTMVADGPSFRILDANADDVVAHRREAKEEETTAASDETEEIVADKKNKVYYPSGCQPPKGIAADDRLVFKSTSEADNAGFKPVKDCTH